MYQPVDNGTFAQRYPEFQRQGYGMGMTATDDRNIVHLEAVKSFEAAYGPLRLIRTGEDGYGRASVNVSLRNLDEGLARLIDEAAIYVGESLGGQWVQENYDFWMFEQFGVQAEIVGPEWWRISKPYKTCPGYTEGTGTRRNQNETPQLTLVDQVEVRNDGIEQETTAQLDERNQVLIRIVVDRENKLIWPEAFLQTDPMDKYAISEPAEGTRVGPDYTRLFPCELVEGTQIEDEEGANEEIIVETPTVQVYPSPDSEIDDTTNNGNDTVNPADDTNTDVVPPPSAPPQNSTPDPTATPPKSDDRYDENDNRQDKGDEEIDDGDDNTSEDMP